MSSAVKAVTTNNPSETTTKKKFGKNLNKLTKPPPPSSVTTTTKSNTSSRNGLLLLSTKRQSSLSSSGGNAATAGGILASKSSSIPSKPLPSLGLHNQSSTSTHDALLGAVVGASRAETQQPDAWGTAEKQQQKSPSFNENGSNVLPLAENQIPKKSTSDGPVVKGDLSNHHGYMSEGEGLHGSSSRKTQIPASTWDEYGGRNVSNGRNGVGNLFNPGGQDGEHDQKVAMSRMARERAEKRRVEEDTRQAEQKERAALRLRELDEKVGSSEGGSQHSASPRIRTLYDPNNPTKSFSAPAGGSKGGESPSNVMNPPKNGTQASTTYASDVHNEGRDAYSRQPVIQLASYDDRDRGDRGAGAGPRMLYDPKSGSMVAVPTRDESNAGRGRKDTSRPRKAKNPREKESKVADSKQDVDGKKGGPKKTKSPREKEVRAADPKQQQQEFDPRKVGGGKKGRRDNNKKMVETQSPPTNAKQQLDPRKGGKVKNKNKKQVGRPRGGGGGAGYSRDNKRGNFVNSDGSDGDLGYSAHSVPSRGRTPNTEAYGRYLEDHPTQGHHPDDLDFYETEATFDTSMRNNSGEALTLKTGLIVPQPAEVKFDWVKPHDKIELVTGVDDSPTLQATAKAWAPSQAALAAAARVNSSLARDHGGLAISADSADEDDDDEDDEDDDDGPFGLGFDPTLNMDSVMHSPTSGPTGLENVDLSALSLEAAFQPMTKSNHIFAFGSGATWGASDTNGGSDNWGVPSSSGNAATFLSLSSTDAWTTMPGLGQSSLGSSSLNGDHSRPTGD